MLGLLALIAGCGTSSRGPATPSGAIRSSPRSGAATATERTTVARGSFVVPAARSFAQRGFHDALDVSGRLRAGGRLPSGPVTIVLALRDASRPQQTCSENHPLSGCVTVDWSDDPARPHVPASGVFGNALTIRTARRVRTLYLHPAGTLTARPEPFAPG